MAKKTLEEKFKEVGFWTFGFVFWYLVVAFFLKSNYPIYEYPFNREDAYDTIKDALTLAAAFLAPVAAFVLFVDWKDEHRVKSNEKLSKEIQNHFFQFMPLVRFYPNFTMTSEDFEQHQRNFYELKFKIKSQLEVVSAHDERSTSYKNKVQKALNKMDSYWIKFVELRQCLKQREDFINSQKKNDDTLKMLNDNVVNCEKEKGDASSWLIRFIDNLEILAV